MIAVVMLTIELLSFAPQSQRTDQLFAALCRTGASAGVQVTSTARYVGGSDLLMVWGPGGSSRIAPMAAQRAAGGHVIAWDLAYWDRFAKMRVSFDAPHPQGWVMRRDWPATRLTADAISVRQHWKADGPIIVAGIGRKAREQYGAAVAAWEAAMIAAARRRWPARPVLYRRKQTDAPVPSGVRLTSDQPIETVLAGASLLLTWHSNVAVDAIRLGIPVICQDGAAAAVCPSTWTETDPRPLSTDLRDRFLRNLAWYQWAPAEAAAFWRWLPEALA